MAAINKRNNLKKEDINKNITSAIGLPKIYSAKIINDIIQILIFNLKCNNKLKIKSFGSFSLQKKNKRTGRNPKNKEIFHISKRTVVLFKASENLKKIINKNASK